MWRRAVAPQIPIHSRARIFGSVKMGVLLLRSCEDRLVPLLHRPWRERAREHASKATRPGGALASKPGAGAVEQLALLAQLLGLVLLVRQVRLWWDEGQEKRKARSCARGEL